MTTATLSPSLPLPLPVAPSRTEVLELHCYADPSNAWLEVNRSTLAALGVDGDISTYSKQLAGIVYLDGFLDMPVFVRAATLAGIPLRTITHVVTERSPIHGMEPYAK